MRIALALLITIVSACLLNLGYLLEHSVASKLPPLSLRRPIARAALAAAQPPLAGGLRCRGPRLEPLCRRACTRASVARSGDRRGRDRDSRDHGLPVHARAVDGPNRIGVAVSVVGLALLGLSLIGEHGEGSGAGYLWVGVWLGASTVAAFVCVMFLARVIGGGPAWGIAAGILFAAGDVSTKMAVSGRAQDIPFLICLIVFYAPARPFCRRGSSAAARSRPRASRRC